MGALPSGKNLGPDTSPSPKMYGLILQNMAEYIQNKHGDNMWKKVGNNRVKNLKLFYGVIFQRSGIIAIELIRSRSLSILNKTLLGPMRSSLRPKQVNIFILKKKLIQS